MNRRAKMLGGGFVASVALAVIPVHAADKPQVGPVPAWVHAAPDPALQTAASKGLPAVVLLNDIQISFDADGWSEFHEVQAKVQAPEGLQALGAIPFQWSPWSDTLTFHRVRILRGGKAIDILPKDGTFTILRREAGLERAMLTGELTALLQPEGLQVGDVLDFAVSLRHADPLLKGRASALLAGWDVSPVGRVRLQARWPVSLPVRWRASSGMPTPVRSEADEIVSVSLVLDDVRPYVFPARAPVRFQQGRQLEFTTFGAWSDVAAVMAPLFAKAAELGPESPLKAEARRLAAASSDPKARAAAALRLVQGQVRYLAHAEAGGGYLPQSADDTWRLRYGDCKAKTALLLALLNALGVPAEPVLASTVAGDGLDAHLPSAALFDHVLVRVRLGDRDYWLDGAREGDRDLDSLPVSAFGWVLPLDAAHAKLVRIGPGPATKPQMTQIIRYDASGGVTAPEPTRLETVFRGDAATVIHAKLLATPADRLDEALRGCWSGVHTAFTPSHVAEAYDASTGEERLTAEGTSKLDWSGTGLELQNVELGGAPDIKRDPATSDPNAPYLLDFPSYVETDESVVLPRGDVVPPAALKAAELNEVLAGTEYKRVASVSGGVFRVVASQRTLIPEVSAAAQRAATDRLTELGKQGVYAPVGAEAAKQASDAAAIESQPTTGQGHVARGNALLDARRYEEAIYEFDAAIALDPRDHNAWSDRAVTNAWTGDTQAATADLIKADALGPSDVYSWHARGLLAERARNWTAAALAYRKALAIDPQDAFAMSRLLGADIALKDYVAATRDDETYLQRHPELRGEALRVRATIEEAQHHHAEALKTLAASPAETADERLLRARSFMSLGDMASARNDVDAALGIAPSASAWLLRASIDGGYDSPAAVADVDAASKIAPDDLDVQLWTVNAATHRQDFARALPMLDRVISAHPDIGNLRVGRALVETRLGRAEAASTDFDLARSAKAADAPDGDVLCATEVKARWRPELALADCRRALERDPSSSSLLLTQAILQHRLGRETDSDKTIGAAEAAARGDPDRLNNLCYGMAGEGMALEKALAACRTSLQLRPGDAATLDSLGFVLLRMGRAAEAVVAYDAVLAKDPSLHGSRFGRGLAEERLGRAADAARDKSSAIAAQPFLPAEFAELGVR